MHLDTDKREPINQPLPTTNQDVLPCAPPQKKKKEKGGADLDVSVFGVLQNYEFDHTCMYVYP